jgi:predicted ABC-type ATPase
MLTSRRRPRIVLVAGPNGAGKSTFIKQYLGVSPLPFTVMNADEIKRQMSGATDAASGRILLQRVADSVAERSNLLIETTLSGYGYSKHITS